jgi:hypothetical protein
MDSSPPFGRNPPSAPLFQRGERGDLGWTEGFVLSEGAVCRRCNNGLAHLDQAVIEDFDIIVYMAGVPRKKGRPPEIRNRGNVIATTGPSGKEISINMERHSVEAHDGSILGAFGKSDRNINVAFEHDCNLAKTSFSVPIGRNPKFVRGIVKIAFSSLAYFLGADAALAVDFDCIRLFVRDGMGERFILLAPTSDTAYNNRVWPPYQSERGEYAMKFRLGSLEFCVDLSPNLTLFPMFKKKATEMYGESGWSYLPIKV